MSPFFYSYCSIAPVLKCLQEQNAHPYLTPLPCRWPIIQYLVKKALLLDRVGKNISGSTKHRFSLLCHSHDLYAAELLFKLILECRCLFQTCSNLSIPYVLMPSWCRFKILQDLWLNSKSSVFCSWEHWGLWRFLTKDYCIIFGSGAHQHSFYFLAELRDEPSLWF